MSPPPNGSDRFWAPTWLAVVFLLWPAVSCWGQSYPGRWQARWIWDSGSSKPFNCFLMVRRSFDQVELPAGASLKITASDRYQLYVNGVYLGRGPARGDPRGMPFDTYDLSAHLVKGRNTLAVLAYYYGTDTGFTRDVRAGLFAQLEMTTRAGDKTILGTDDAWRVRRAKAWSGETKRINNSVGVTEVYDARVDPVDWMATGFDDSGWETANMKLESFQGTVPWSYLEPRHTPMLREREVFPEKIARTGEVAARPPADLAVPEQLATEPHYPLAHAIIENPEAMLAADGNLARLAAAPLRLEGRLGDEKRSPYVIFDFGRPIFGFPRLRLNAPAGQTVDVAYGARLLGEADVKAWQDDAPAGKGPPADFRARLGRPDLLFLPGFRYGDRYITREGEQTWTVFEYKLFRYLMVVFRNADAPVQVDAVSGVAYEYPVERRGAFACSDPVLTRLWQACVDTAFLHMEDALICDAIRERRVWTGDGGHGLFGIWAGYGDPALNDWFFRQISRGQLADGMLRMYYPGRDIFVDTKPIPGGRDRPPPPMDEPLNIPQFAFFYVHLLGEQFRLTGNKDLLGSLYPGLVRLVDWCERHSDDTGLLYGLPNWNFVDWVKTDMRGANFETNALYYRLLTEMVFFAKSLGHPAQAAAWDARAQNVRSKIRALHWNEAKGLFAAGYSERRQSATFTETANGMALLFGLADEKQIPRIVAHLANPGAELLRSSPLYYNYTLEGLIRVDVIDDALKLMHSRYQAMVMASDAPTMWENWDANRRRDQTGRQNVSHTSSQVHSGSVGPAWILSKYILGVSPDGPGFQKCFIEPRIGSLAEASGVVPTVRGDIKVGWRKQGKRFSIEVVLPAGLETEIYLPVGPERITQLSHNGLNLKSSNLALHPNKTVVRVVGGAHKIEVETAKR